MTSAMVPSVMMVVRMTMDPVPLVTSQQRTEYQKQAMQMKSLMKAKGRVVAELKIMVCHRSFSDPL